MCPNKKECYRLDSNWVDPNKMKCYKIDTSKLGPNRVDLTGWILKKRIITG